MPQKPASVLAAAQPLSLADIRISRPAQDGSIDLKTRSLVRPAAETLDTIERGALTHASIASPILLPTAVPPDED